MTTQIDGPALLEALAGAVERQMASTKSEAYGRAWMPGLQAGYRHDASGTATTTGFMIGPGGVLSYPGVDPAVFHTVVGARGLLSRLPTMGSPYTDPTYQVITGVQDVSGDEPDAPCDDAPTAGVIKSCILTAPFGRYMRATPELDLNRLGQRTDRADPMDLALVGSPLQQAGVFASGPGSAATPSDLLANEMSKRFWELGIAFQRLLSRQLWSGNPSNNTGADGYREIAGLDALVNTGHRDAVTGTLCPSTDADLKDFDYANVTENGSLLVEMLTLIYWTRKQLAMDTGVDPVRWVLVMRESMFHAVSEVWPCSYLTFRCDLPDNGRVVIDGAEQIRMRDQMRSERFLPIEGDRIEVITDEAIAVDTSTTNANVPEGCRASDIYLLPMSVVGGRSVLHLEYLDHGPSNAALRTALGTGLPIARVDANGAFITTARQTNFCMVWQAKIEPRLVLRTPWLAGRIQNVVECQAQTTRSPFPDDPYFVDGGNTTRTGPSYYAAWKS